MKQGEMIKIIRIRIGLNQKDFSRLLGITQTYLSFLESAKRCPSVNLSYKIKDLAKKHGILITLEDIHKKK